MGRVGCLQLHGIGWRHWLAALILAGLALTAVAPDVHGAGWANFGRASATSSFGEGLSFRQPVTLSEEASQAEVLLSVAGTGATTVIEVPPPAGTGSQSLSFDFDPTVEGHLLPNTPLTVQWRLTNAADDVQLGPTVDITYDDDRFDWRTQAGDLVRVHWYEGSAGFGERALRIAEEGVASAQQILGVTETDPVDFFVYADQDAFYDALGPGTRENVGGQANAEIRTLFALISPNEIDDSWVGVVIPHELVHLVFDTAARNPYHFPPRWLNEGLAVYLSQGYGSSDRGEVERAASSGTLIPLDGITGQFPTSFERFSLAYSESVSAVDYFIRTYERDALVSLIRSYAQGRTDDEAFEAVAGKGMVEFGEDWQAELGAQPPTRFGPQPAPPGPVPAAWQGEPGSSPASSGGAAPTRAPAASPGSGASTGDGGVGLVIFVGIVAVLVIVGGFLLARRRSAGPESPSPS